MAKNPEPIRMCVVCRRRAPRGELVRLVISGGKPRLDHEQRLPGRGAYVCPRPACQESLVQEQGLGRALRAPLSPQARQNLLQQLRISSARVPAQELGRS